MTKEHGEFSILLVEDEEADAELVLNSLKSSKLLSDCMWVSSGEEALDYLKKKGTYSNARRPDLVLLDLNMPGTSGREVLQEVKKDDDLKTIPVAVMTSSEAEEDVAESYAHHCNCYIRKPVNIEEIGKIVQAIECFWFSVVTIPPKK